MPTKLKIWSSVLSTSLSKKMEQSLQTSMALRARPVLRRNVATATPIQMACKMSSKLFIVSSINPAKDNLEIKLYGHLKNIIF